MVGVVGAVPVRTVPRMTRFDWYMVIGILFAFAALLVWAVTKILEVAP